MNAYSEKSAELSDYYLHQDWNSYRIIIHSTKSTSKAIGANMIYEPALELEKAAKNEDDIYIMDNHDKFIELYREISEEIRKTLQ